MSSSHHSGDESVAESDMDSSPGPSQIMDMAPSMDSSVTAVNIGLAPSVSSFNMGEALNPELLSKLESVMDKLTLVAKNAETIAALQGRHSAGAQDHISATTQTSTSAPAQTSRDAYTILRNAAETTIQDGLKRNITWMDAPISGNNGLEDDDARLLTVRVPVPPSWSIQERRALVDHMFDQVNSAVAEQFWLSFSRPIDSLSTAGHQRILVTETIHSVLKEKLLENLDDILTRPPGDDHPSWSVAMEDPSDAKVLSDWVEATLSRPKRFVPDLQWNLKRKVFEPICFKLDSLDDLLREQQARIGDMAGTEEERKQAEASASSVQLLHSPLELFTALVLQETSGHIENIWKTVHPTQFGHPSLNQYVSHVQLHAVSTHFGPGEYPLWFVNPCTGISVPHNQQPTPHNTIELSEEPTDATLLNNVLWTKIDQDRVSRGS